MLRSRVILYLTLVLISFVSVLPSKHGVDLELKDYAKEVKRLSNGNLNAKGLHINFTDKYPKELGSCYFWRSEILINFKHWQKMNYYDKIALMAHEIAHCQKDLDHINGLDNWGCAKHFMHYAGTGKWCNRIRFKRYVKQMQEI